MITRVRVLLSLQRALLGTVIVIRGFRQCVFEYLEYVNETPRVRSYDRGEVWLVAVS